MNKMIINNRTSLTDAIALEMVSKVVMLGRISNDEKQYCYGTAINVLGVKYMVVTDLNKRSDRFIVTKYGKSS